MPTCQTLPMLWLLSDARNDAALEASLGDLPKGSGFVFRHYHLAEAERRERFDALAMLARPHRHIVVLSGTAEVASAWGADGIYGPTEKLGPPGELLRLTAAHDTEELRAAQAARADAVFLSPVFPTASHPGETTLGVSRFHALAEQSTIPVIALGGMTADRARELGWPRWGAIDGLVSTNPA